ncbi:hypothetical protein VR010_13405 [Actinomycetaceae bacterium L2_0104]
MKQTSPRQIPGQPSAPHPELSRAELFAMLASVVDGTPGVVRREATMEDFARSFLPTGSSDLDREGMKVTRGGDGVSVVVALNVDRRHTALAVTLDVVAQIKSALSACGLNPVQITIKVWEMS